jgi:hypothetical protein
MTESAESPTTVPEERPGYGKKYRIKVSVDGEPQGASVYVHLVGTFSNDGNVYDVPDEVVADFERGCPVPFSELSVPSNCELIVVEEGV